MSRASIMAAADQLLELMFSWIEEGVHCAELLEKLANKLESVRKKCCMAELVGIIAQVLAAVCKILANILILLQPASQAAPVLEAIEKALGCVSCFITTAAEAVQHSSFYFILREAEETVEKINTCTETIHRQLKQLRLQVKKKFLSAGSDDVDRHVVMEIVRAVARRSGLKLEDDISAGFYFNADQKTVNIKQSCEELYSAAAAAKEKAVNIYQFYSSITGETGFTASDARCEAVTGGCELIMAGRQGINKWYEMYKVSEVSRSLTDAADAIREMCRTQRKQFDAIREMCQRQRKQSDAIRRNLEKMDRGRRQTQRRKSAAYLIVAAILFCLCLTYYFKLIWQD